VNFGRVATAAAIAAAVAAVAYYANPSPSPQTSGVRQGSGKGAAGRPVPVITADAASEDFRIRRRTIGTLESPAVVVIRSRIDSQVLDQHVSDGQLVRKDDLLFTLDDREIQALIARDEAQLAKDNATLTQAQADLGRKQELIEKDVAPQQQLDQATAVYKAAQQTVEADQAVLQADRLKLGYAKIQAPITGRVGAVRVTPGNLVGVNDTGGLATITQIKPIRVAFTLAERDLAAVRKAFAAKPPATVRVFTPGSDKPLEEGQLDFVDSGVDPSSGTIAVKGRFANPNLELWPGMFVDVEIDLSVQPNTVMIPSVAIQTGQKGPFVFVLKDDQTVEMRMVELVGIEGNKAALKSGVSAGESIVIEGQMRLTDGTRVAKASPEAAASEAPAEDKAKGNKGGTDSKAAR
jgi:multidrug efflux system membrane fusion protein